MEGKKHSEKCIGKIYKDRWKKKKQRKKIQFKKKKANKIFSFNLHANKLMYYHKEKVLLHKHIHTKYQFLSIVLLREVSVK